MVKDISTSGKFNRYERILTQNYMLMDHPDGWFYTGVYHQRRGEYSLASIAYENLLNQFPNSEYVLNTFKNLSFVIEY